MSQRTGTGTVPPNKVEKQIPSALPLYGAAAAFLAAALLLPVYSLWGLLLCAAAAGTVYAVCRKMFPPRIVYVPAPATVFETGERELNETLAAAEKDITALAQLNERIPDEALSQNISRMETAAREILRQVAKTPSKARAIRKFVSYYLPTSVKLLTTYAELAASGAQGARAQGLMQDIRTNASTIATAFEAQLDSLFAQKVLDVSADIAVLDSMMKGDGLGGTDAVQQAAAPKLQL